MAKHKGKRLALVGVSILGAVVIAAAATAAGMLLERSHFARPDAFADAVTPSQAPVASRAYFDPQKVTVSLTRTTPTPIASPLSGRVTAVNCSPGAAITTGSTPLELDGQKVVVLHTRVPLWRGMETGTKGDDVVGLQEALAAAGHDVAATGTYGSVTDKALRAVLRAAGLSLTNRDPTPFDHIAWIPQDTITAETCPFSLGDQVAQGQDIITLPQALTQITVQNPSANRMPGARTLDLNGFTIVTPDDGVVTDPEQLAAVASSPEYRYGVAVVADAVISVEMEWRLQDSIDVASVPPRAIFGLNDHQGCVATGDTTLPVTVVSSSLGSALVRFADGAVPPTTVDLDRGDRSCP